MRRSTRDSHQQYRRDGNPKDSLKQVERLIKLHRAAEGGADLPVPLLQTQEFAGREHQNRQSVAARQQMIVVRNQGDIRSHGQCGKLPVSRVRDVFEILLIELAVMTIFGPENFIEKVSRERRNPTNGILDLFARLVIPEQAAVTGPDHTHDLRGVTLPVKPGSDKNVRINDNTYGRHFIVLLATP